jgi:hypothetical protein
MVIFELLCQIYNLDHTTVNDCKKKLEEATFDHKDLGGCTCKIASENEMLVTHNINKVTTWGQLNCEHFWRSTYKGINNEVRYGQAKWINVYGPDFIGKKQVLYSLARRWHQQHSLCGYKLIWFLNGENHERFKASCKGACEAMLVNNLLHITERSLFIVFDINTQSDWEKYREELSPLTNCKVIALSRNPLHIGPSFKMSPYQFCKGNFLETVEIAKRIIGWIVNFY